MALDAALRDAFIADFNLIRVTSIVPPGVGIHAMPRGDGKPIDGNGAMLPAVYEVATTYVEGQRVSAAIGVGVPLDPKRAGVIFTNSGVGLEERECVEQVAQFVSEGMTLVRGCHSYEFKTCSASAIGGGGGTWTTALAALCFCDAALWRFFQHRCTQVGHSLKSDSVSAT